jgi:hypothetical protein
MVKFYPPILNSSFDIINYSVELSQINRFNEIGMQIESINQIRDSNLKKTFSHYHSIEEY